MRRRLTFPARLTLAYAAIVAVAVVLLGTVAFVTVRLALDTALETRLETTVKAARSIVDIRHGRMEDLHGDDLVQFQALLGQGLNGAVLHRDGTLMSSNLSAPPVALLAGIAASASPRGVVRVDRGSTAYVVLAITDRGVRYGTIVAWESRSVYEEAVRITLLALGIAGLIVVIAGAAAAGTLTRRMLSPVKELSAMISEIEATDLGERIAWDGPDDELKQLCVTFDRLLDRLETAVERERRFIADASHELRTPLTVMRAEIELALMHERTPEAYRSALQRLQREMQRLEALAQNLILTTRDGASASPAYPIRAAEVAERATARMRPLATSRDIVLSCDAVNDVDVVAYGDMLERAIVALIDNALRFARRTIEISVSSNGNGANIAVSDDGPGFSESALRNATNRFWRDDPARSGDGTGLGLTIARSIVEQHQGSIALQNRTEGNGAVVVLSVPKSP